MDMACQSGVVKGVLLISWRLGLKLTLMPSMVRLVSAMLVASTTFRAPTGVVSKMRAYRQNVSLKAVMVIQALELDISYAAG